MAESKELTKEQQQTIFLGVVFVVGFIYCVFAYGLTPMEEEYAKAQKDIKAYKAEILKGEGLKRSENKVNEMLATNKAKLNEILSKMPPRTNPMVWSAALVRKVCQNVGIPSNMRTTKAIGRQASVNKKKKAKNPDYFEQYTVQVSLVSGYHKVGAFVAELELEVPFAYISNISMSRSRDHAGKINAVVTCVFPRLSAVGEKAVKEGMKL